jgi:hypothetical protein
MWVQSSIIMQQSWLLQARPLCCTIVVGNMSSTHSVHPHCAVGLLPYAPIKTYRKQSRVTEDVQMLRCHLAAALGGEPAAGQQNCCSPCVAGHSQRRSTPGGKFDALSLAADHTDVLTKTNQSCRVPFQQAVAQDTVLNRNRVRAALSVCSDTVISRVSRSARHRVVCQFSRVAGPGRHS